MNLGDFLRVMSALHGPGNGQRQRRSQADQIKAKACMVKMEKMHKCARDTTKSMHDKYGMLSSARTQFAAYWPEEWDNPEEHRAYLCACDDAAFAILAANSQAAVLAAWRGVEKPEECNKTKPGDSAQLLLDAIAEARYFELGVAALPVPGEPVVAE